MLIKQYTISPTNGSLKRRTIKPPLHMKSYNNINIFYHQTLACLLTCQWRYKYIVYLKNRWGGAYWQSSGLTVIPTISWGDERSFEFCRC